jgi:hypothetical protein
LRANKIAQTRAKTAAQKDKDKCVHDDGIGKNPRFVTCFPS